MIIDTNFQTPANVIQYMISLIPENIDDVLEPTPGIGNIVTALCEKGFTVTSAEDYFLIKKRRFGAIVGNPPFSSKSADLTNAPVDFPRKGMQVGYEILKGCMEMSDNIIMIVPWFTISDSDVRMRFIKDFGLISVTPLPRKTFNYARIQTVVLNIQKGYKGETLFDTRFFECKLKKP